MGGYTLDDLRWVEARPDEVTTTPRLAAPLDASVIKLRVGTSIEIDVPLRSTVYVDGERVKRRRQQVALNSTIRINDQLLFYLTEREPFTPRRYPDSAMRPFGEIDGANIVGESPKAWRFREQIAAASRCEKGVMLRGSWYGGRRAARSIHELSRRTGLFWDADAWGFAWDIIFVGNAERTTDDTEHDGMFGLANFGSLYLQLHSDVPAPLVEALRDLDAHGGWYWPIADSEARKTTFVMIVNADRDADLRELPDEITRRVEVEIVVPCLNDRREDIPLAARDRLLEVSDAYPDPQYTSLVRTGLEGRRYVTLPPRSVERLMLADHKHLDDVSQWCLGEELERLAKESRRRAQVT